MESKLQKLTDKIYKEGVVKAEEEADKIIEESKQEASNINELPRSRAARYLI
jgi:V/A-type H+-transporting ATPase subunit E|tara:strand:- start:789 stop:944 length:156 start_codon:yes stop_codon:yes gene_type:complete